MEIFQLINEDGMIEFKYHDFATSNEITYHQMAANKAKRKITRNMPPDANMQYCLVESILTKNQT